MVLSLTNVTRKRPRIHLTRCSCYSNFLMSPGSSNQHNQVWRDRSRKSTALSRPGTLAGSPEGLAGACAAALSINYLIRLKSNPIPTTFYMTNKIILLTRGYDQRKRSGRLRERFGG